LVSGQAQPRVSTPTNDKGGSVPSLSLPIPARILRPLRFVFMAGTSVLLFWLLVRDVNLQLMGHTLAHAQLLYLLPISVAFFVRYWLRAVRWRRLVRHLREIPTGHCFDRVVLCQAADRMLPAQLSYPVTVQLAAAKFQIGPVQLFGTDLIERMMDGCVYAVFLAVALATLRIGAAYTGVTAFLVVGTAIGMSLGWWLTRRPRDKRVPANWPFARFLRQFLEGLETIQEGRKTLWLFGVSLAIWFVEAGIYLLVGLALGIHLNPLVGVFLVAMANTGAAVPLAQAAVGFIFVAQRVLEWSGHTASAATTYAATLEVLLLLSVLLLAPAAAYRLRVGWQDFLPRRRPAPVPVRID